MVQNIKINYGKSILELLFLVISILNIFHFIGFDLFNYNTIENYSSLTQITPFLTELFNNTNNYILLNWGEIVIKFGLIGLVLYLFIKDRKLSDLNKLSTLEKLSISFLLLDSVYILFLMNNMVLSIILSLILVVIGLMINSSNIIIERLMIKIGRISEFDIFDSKISYIIQILYIGVSLFEMFNDSLIYFKLYILFIILFIPLMKIFKDNEIIKSIESFLILFFVFPILPIISISVIVYKIIQKIFNFELLGWSIISIMFLSILYFI